MKPTLRTVPQPGAEPHAPPPDLSADAAAHFRRLRDDYQITDSYGLFILGESMRSWDRAERARALIAKHGELIGAGSRIRRNPACSVESAARAAALKGLRELGCETVATAQPGRPRGR